MSVRELVGWGRFPRVMAEERVSEDLAAATHEVNLTRGLGRSYGDSSLPGRAGDVVARTTAADRILFFDEKNGILRAEAGFSLQELVRVFLPRGWFTPVSPGTQFVTLGGMVASDIHGKNHHVAGCFGEHVRALKMRVPDGRILEVTEESEPDLFRATIGGMGLTGHILEVEFQLEAVPSPWIWGESERVANLEELLDKQSAASEEWPFTVSWVDTVARGRGLGRGIVMKGRWATSDEAPQGPPKIGRSFSVPFDFPSWALAPWSMRIFNHLYFWKHLPRRKRGIVHPQKFFYPLDIVQHWNRVYGSRGFVQYQCVLPQGTPRSVHHRFFEALSQGEVGSFLSVVKDCGEEGKGLLSFPKAGVSVALDIPMRGRATQELVDTLNEIVVDAGGRIYLAKDSLTRENHFRAMETRLPMFAEVRNAWDPELRLMSAQSARLFGDRETEAGS